MKLRPYQIEIAFEIAYKLLNCNIAYLSAEVRTGKTLMALEACKLRKAKKVLFLTKKKAISSIEGDYKDFGYEYDLTVINYESLHKIESNDFDVIIYDESHTISAFPKPSKRSKEIKKRFSKIPCIFLTGTPAIESGSQWYHQFYVSDYSPFTEYKNFYKWAKDFVTVKQRNFGYAKVNDYSNADRDKIKKVINHLVIIFSQEDAGFETVINEKVLYCDIEERTHSLVNRLIKDRVVEGKTDIILADTPVKLQSKVHQIYNGTCIGESGSVILLDSSKAKFIKDRFNGKKIGIFYYFKGELELIKSIFGNDITTVLEEFQTTNKSVAIQQSGSEGLNLSKADYLVYYNFGFSGKNYVQSRDRLSTLQRKTNDIYFVFENNGISELIYKRIKEKKSYNVSHFKRDYGI